MTGLTESEYMSFKGVGSMGVSDVLLIRGRKLLLRTPQIAYISGSKEPRQKSQNFPKQSMKLWRCGNANLRLLKPNKI